VRRMSEIPVALKVAIVTSGKTQRRLALEAGVPEGRLSAIVRGWEDPTPAEREALARVLEKPAPALFQPATVELRAI
jgi:hypothetical protein